jgi:hypothetical protein
VFAVNCIAHIESAEFTKPSEEREHSVSTYLASFASLRTDFDIMLTKLSFKQFGFCHSVIRGTDALVISARVTKFTMVLSNTSIFPNTVRPSHV